MACPLNVPLWFSIGRTNACFDRHLRLLFYKHPYRNSCVRVKLKIIVQQLFCFFTDIGADSQSSLGTAFAFSRPNKVALSLSNTSLLLEYTSRVFLNSLQE